MVRELSIGLLLLAVLFSCQEEIAIAEIDPILGLASPIQSGVEEKTINLSGYFLYPEKIDSISSKNGALSWKRDGQLLTIGSGTQFPPVSTLDFHIGDQVVSIPVYKSEKVEHEFFYPAERIFKIPLQIKGEMNSWNINTHRLDYDVDRRGYVCRFVTNPGRYQYKMVKAGSEFLDPHNPDSVPNGLGSFNSIIQIGEPATRAPHLEAQLDEGGILLSCQNQTEVIALIDNKRVNVEQSGENWVPIIPEGLEGRAHLRVWVHDGKQRSNEILIPLADGRPIEDAANLKRTDKHALTLYNVFVDRFHNGDTTNDRPVETGTVLPLANNLGGDIKGAIEKLESGYFEDLGINTIWISPVVKNVEGPYGLWPEPKTEFSAYHGYWPISFTQVDERLTTEEDLHELVDKAHSRDMNVLLDFVANHVHEEHPFYKADTTVATDLYLEDGRLNTELWDEHRLTTWFDIFLPSLRLDEPRVYEMLTDSCVYWIDKYDLDGFRHDAAKHVPRVFWETLTYKLKKQIIEPKGKVLYQIGETYGTPELIGSYVGTDQLDGQFDFNVYDAMVAALAQEGGDFQRLDEELKKSLRAYGDHHLMGNITGNQDRARFISYAGGEIRFDEHPKVAGWTREIGVGPESSYAKLEQLQALVATVPGVPVIYYGDEYGSCGGGDPDNRKMMQFEGLSARESGCRENARSLMKLHRSSMALMYGDMRTHMVEEDVFVFSRNYLNEHVLVLLNSSDQARRIELTDYPKEMINSPMKSFSSIKTDWKENNMLSIQLPAHSFEILQLK